MSSIKQNHKHRGHHHKHHPKAIVAAEPGRCSIQGATLLSSAASRFSVSPIECMPPELQVEILGRLDAASRFVLSMVSRSFLATYQGPRYKRLELLSAAITGLNTLF